MPVRKIPKNYLGVTGSFASVKNGRMVQFESLLERDCMIQLEFDEQVVGFEEQPVKIPFKKGVKPYVPDLLIQHKSKSNTLAEVKPSHELKKHEEKFKPKFEAAKEFANDKGWDFEVLTENEGRNAQLKTLKFLREYLHVTPDQPLIETIIVTLDRLGKKSTLNDLINEITNDLQTQMLLIPMIWHLVVIKRIHIDYEQPISSDTLLELLGN